MWHIVCQILVFLSIILLWLTLLYFFFIKHSNNFFTIKIINNICLWHSIFNFFTYKNFFWPIRSIDFCKNVFVFWYSYLISNFKFRIIAITFFIRVNTRIIFSLTGFILIVLWYVLLYLLTILSNPSIYTVFDNKVIYL